MTEDFDSERADELTVILINAVMQSQRDEGRDIIYEALFALATTVGVVLEATGDDIDKTRPWFEVMVTRKITEARNVRAQRRRN